MAGLVEVYFNSEWMTVCKTSWSIQSSKVACNMLDYQRVIATGHLGPGNGTIWRFREHNFQWLI